MKFDFDKLTKNEMLQTYSLIAIILCCMLLICDCPVSKQINCTVIIMLAMGFNFLQRKDDSPFTQIRTPLITCFMLLMNKVKTTLDFIIKPEVLENYDILKLNFENSPLPMIFLYIGLLVFGSATIYLFFEFNSMKERISKIERLPSAKERNDKFPVVVIPFGKFLCIITFICAIVGSTARPVYEWIISGEIDYTCFQKYIIVVIIDLILHITAISFLFLSLEFYNFTLTRESGGFLITEDNIIIKYKGKNKIIYVPQNYKLYMTNTFENCDSSYEIHFEEGTTEIPPLKFKKSMPQIFYPSSLVSLREYSLFIKNQNPFDNTATIQMLLNNPVFKIIDGCLVNTKNNTLLFKIEHKETEFKIPDGIERIGKYAFDDLLLYKAFNSDESVQQELKERYNKYNNFSNGRDKEYEKFGNSAASNRIQLKKISFNKNISYVHPDALELATGLREIFVPEDSDFDISEINPSRPYIKYLGKGKKITHRMIERLLHIHEKIKSGCYPNSKQLAYDLETSEPTINRDIEYLRDSRDAPIQYDFTNRGYYYTQDYELFFEK
ncbi:MAG: leucine-rich repeat protein [Treponema sp.]|nr:leucine-rich repeat protein [Treponema sp.]